MKNDVRNTKIKKLMINKKVQRCKSSSLGTKRKSEKKNEEKINNMKVINNDNENFDFNIKNELELADKIYKANQLKIEENKIEDDEINNLNEQIRKLMINNYELQQKIQNQLNLRITYEKNQKEIASYINDLNYKFRNYDETVRNYESAMNKLRKENKKLTDEYDKKIERIEKENNKLKKRVEDRIELYLHQKGEIEEKTAKTRNLEKEIKDQEKLVKERIKINKAKAKELEEKYDDMYKKVINLEVNLEDQKLTNLLKRDLFIIEENDTKKIFDKNKSLLYELRELNKKYENLILDKRKSIKSGKHTYSFQSTTNRSNRTTTGDINFSINKEIQGTQTSKYK
jgi:DNA repair exonuclease SbcCD ATPase subunit